MKIRFWILFVLILAADLVFPFGLELSKPIEVVKGNTGIEGIDSIYCINLDIRKDKWNVMQERFAQAGLKVNRVPAINGWTDLSRKIRRKLKAPNKSSLSPGMIGCLLSHLSVLKDAAARKFKQVLVLEDDVEFIEPMKEVKEYLDMLSVEDPDWDILFLDHWKAEDFGVLQPNDRPNSPMSEVIKKPREILIPTKLNRIYYRHGLYAMVVSEKGIQKILKHFFDHSLSLPLDIEMNHIDQIKLYETDKNFIKVNLQISDTSIKPKNPKKKK